MSWVSPWSSITCRFYLSPISIEPKVSLVILSITLTAIKIFIATRSTNVPKLCIHNNETSPMRSHVLECYDVDNKIVACESVIDSYIKETVILNSLRNCPEYQDRCCIHCSRGKRLDYTTNECKVMHVRLLSIWLIKYCVKRVISQ